MIKIAPSILSADYAALGEAVVNLKKWKADYVHCDVMDGVFVPNITFGMPMIAALRKYTDMTLDVHLMITEPERYIDGFIKAGSDVITFHPDASKCVKETLLKVKKAGIRCGLVLNPDKSLALIEPYLDIVDMVVIMGVYAGFGGQKFIPETLDKIAELKERRGNRHFEIEMDGGANLGNAQALADAGVDVLVAGSAVFGATDPAAAITALKG